MPPRHGKTQLIGRWFPFHYLTIFPDREIIYATHSASKARQTGQAVRDLVDEFGHLFGIQTHPGARAVDSWRLMDRKGRPTGGGMRSVGRRTGIHGDGASLFILDDLFGDMEDVLSDTTRDAVWRWCHGTVATRLSPIGAVVHIGTPFFSDDVFGRFQEAENDGGDKWTRLRLPALSEGPGDPMGRTEGAALWPSMFPADFLEQKRRAFEAAGDLRDWHAQYMLAPLGGDGTSEWPSTYFPASILFNEFPQDGILVKVISVDPSKGRQRGDYSAIITIYLDDKLQLWVDCDMARRPINVLEDAVVTNYALHRPHGAVIEVNGEQALIYVNVLEKLRKLPQLGVAINVKPQQAVDGGGKFKPRIRINLDQLIKEGRIHIRNSPGGRMLLSQLKNYPYGKHDDGPDALSQGVVYLNELLMKLPVKPSVPRPVRAVG